MQILFLLCKYINSLIFPWNFVKFINVPDFFQIPWLENMISLLQFFPDFQCEWELWIIYK